MLLTEEQQFEENIRKESLTNEEQSAQNQLNELDQEKEDEHRCRNCGIMNIEEGYPFPLCHDCRKSLSSRPIPFKIKGFFVLVLAIALTSLVTFPASLEAGVAYQRGIMAEKDKKF